MKSLIIALNKLMRTSLTGVRKIEKVQELKKNYKV